MKSLLIILLALGSFAAKAAPKEPITPVVLESFNNSFRNVADVSWSESKYFFKAEFLFNDRSISAFFSKGGMLIATSRNLVFGELPLFLQMELKSDYKGYWISDLFELTREDEMSYYITIENGDQRVVLQSEGNCWKVYEKKSK